MRICRLQIRNFRNFKNLDVEVGSHLVIVGENRVGKSNLLHALRLILDPSLPDSARRLRLEDFWDGAKPIQPDSEINVSIDLTDFENNEKQFAVLSDYSIAHSPMVARLTYAFFPKQDLDSDPKKESDYDFSVYGGDDPTRLISPDVRRRLPMDLLPALRDAESDLANWRRSPLRPLLDSLAGAMDEDAKDALAAAMNDAANAVAESSEVNALSAEIKDALAALAGMSHTDSPTLAIAPTDTDRLIRTLRLFIDGGLRGISEASLGSSNLIYLALKLLSLQLEISEKVRDHGFLAIEEPEAHLHPHVQRRVFRSFLRTRSPYPITQEQVPERTILLTTHSPHVASVTPLLSVVLLRTNDKPKHTIARSIIGAGLEPVEIDDLERYLDVTRGEMLFAKAVILVEGVAEEYLIPVLAKLLGYDLDELGISVCSVAGTNFIPYAKLLGERGYGIPFAMITDEDPQNGKECLAVKRVWKIIQAMETGKEYSDDKDEFFGEAEGDGIFVTDHTLEIALFRSGRHRSVTTAIEQLSGNRDAIKRARAWRDVPQSLDEEQFLNDIAEIGKGRFAQRLSSIIKGTSCPYSIKKAIEYVVEQL